RGSSALAIIRCISSSLKQRASFLTPSRGMVRSAMRKLPQAYSQDRAVLSSEDRDSNTFSTVFLERPPWVKGKKLGRPSIAVDAARIARLRVQGLTVRQIATELGHSRSLRLRRRTIPSPRWI